MCGLEPEEVAAICEHEQICEVQAAALASYLPHQAHGAERIRTMIIEDIDEARNRGEVKHAAQLVACSTISSIAIPKRAWAWRSFEFRARPLSAPG
jgi:hypothetical protein